MTFSSQLRYAEFNLQVQVKLEFVMTSVRTQGYYRETVGVGKNASFKITENVCGQNPFISRYSILRQRNFP